MPDMKRKPLYLNGVSTGTARTWHEVAAILSTLLRRPVSDREVQNHGSEGPDGFYVALPNC